VQWAKGIISSIWICFMSDLFYHQY